jgi:hypothetical protein
MLKISRAVLQDVANLSLAIAAILAGIALALAVFGTFGDSQIIGMQTGMGDTLALPLVISPG